MAIRNWPQSAKFWGRQAFTVPVTAGNYAEARITIGTVGAGDKEDTFQEIMALAETLVPGATVELWLRRVSFTDKAASAMTDADYTLAGTNFGTLTAAGGQRWQLSGWPGAQIRVKSGGTPGTMTISATAL